MFSNKISLSEATDKLKNAPDEFILLFQHGTLELELYRPNLIDRQTPHQRDEVYVIASGEAVFELENEITSVKTGDFLFVPAYATHKFVEFSEDFSTWVLFYGPAGGEKP